MMSKYCFLTVIGLAFLQGLDAWAPSPSAFSRRLSQSSSPSLIARKMVESLSLELMGDNHEEVGVDLAGSVQRWLDAEWMPQDVHVKMGESCKLSYVQCRKEGESDLMAIMMQVADDLSEDWGQYDKDAFVNAWDVSNYVSDYLTSKSGVEGCECAARIY